MCLMKVLFIILLGTHGFQVVKSYSNGAVYPACESMMPQHPPFLPQNISNPYEIIVKNISWDKVIVILNATSEPFRGFLLEAEDSQGRRPFGTFTLVDPKETQILNCDGNSASAVSHRRNNNKRKISVTWTRPTEENNYKFRATFVQRYNIFWVAEFRDPISSTSPTSTTSTGIVTSNELPAVTQITDVSATMSASTTSAVTVASKPPATISTTAVSNTTSLSTTTVGTVKSKEPATTLTTDIIYITVVTTTTSSAVISKPPATTSTTAVINTNVAAATAASSVTSKPPATTSTTAVINTNVAAATAASTVTSKPPATTSTTAVINTNVAAATAASSVTSKPPATTSTTAVINTNVAAAPAASTVTSKPPATTSTTAVGNTTSESTTTAGYVTSKATASTLTTYVVKDHNSSSSLSTATLLVNLAVPFMYGSQTKMVFSSYGGFWFPVHVLLMSLFACGNIIALILVFIEGWRTEAHTAVVCVVTVLTVIQIVLAFFRCGKSHELRFIFNWFHRLNALAIVCFTVAAVFTGLAVIEAASPKQMLQELMGGLVTWEFLFFILQLSLYCLRKRGKDDWSHKMKKIHCVIQITLLVVFSLGNAALLVVLLERIFAS